MEELAEAGVVERGVFGGDWCELGLCGAATSVAVSLDLGDVASIGVGAARSGSGSTAVVHGRRVVSNCRLRPLLGRNFVGNVGTAQCADVNVKVLANPFAEQADSVLGDIDTLDAANATSKGENVTFQLVANIVNELMGKVEDEDAGVFDGVGEGGVGDEVVGESDAWEIFDVFVVRVDNVCELLGLVANGGVVVFGVFGQDDVFFEHPHLHLLFEEILVLPCVFGDDLGNG